MKIDSKDFKIKDIFSRKVYTIPDYQRNYSWTALEEISIFWDDFLYYMDNDEELNFFIGPMVFQGNSINSTFLEVVDGQQRLITFSILLSVLVSLFDEYGEENLSKGLKNLLIFKDESNKEQLVIRTEDPHPFFQKKIFHNDLTIKPEKDSEKLIEKARKYFDAEIRKLLIGTKEEKVKILIKIRDFVFKVDTVVIVSDNETDAFTIFETINTRGKNLKSLDLLKNYIFKNFSNQAGVDEPKETWKKIIENINKTESFQNTFFNRFWASWVYKVTESKLYRRFSYYMRSEKNKNFTSIGILINELEISSNIYKKILSPKVDDWKKDNNIEVYYFLKHAVGHFNVKVVIPFLLSIIEEYQKKNINRTLFLNTLRSIENFHFIFSHIVSPRASGLDGKYSKFAIKLRKDKDKEKVIKELLSDLKNKIPTKTEYKEKFKELNYIEDKDTIKYILLRLERELNPSKLVDLEENSIEHLYPKSSSIKNKNNIGNLFLLEANLNEWKKNKKPFEKIDRNIVINELIKKTTYKRTKKELTLISLEKKWNKDKVEERMGKLTEETYIIFSKV